MWHLYIVPLITIPGPGGKEVRVPKYLWDLPYPTSQRPFGSQLACLGAIDVDDATDASIAAHSDVTRIPDNLDQAVNVSATQNALEGLHIPADWVNASHTYRQVLRLVLSMFAFFQRYRTISGVTVELINGSTVTLSTRFNQLPAQVRTDLIATANDLHYDTSGLSGNNTLRQILKGMADQFGAHVWNVGGIAI